MKSDLNGCSTCAAGHEKFEKFNLPGRNKGTAYEYEYRDTDGSLFSTVKKHLHLCRDARDMWLAGKARTVREKQFSS